MFRNPLNAGLGFVPDIQSSAAIPDRELTEVTLDTSADAQTSFVRCDILKFISSITQWLYIDQTTSIELTQLHGNCWSAQR